MPLYLNQSGNRPLVQHRYGRTEPTRGKADHYHFHTEVQLKGIQ